MGGSESPFQFCFLKALGSQVGFQDDAGREELENRWPKCAVQPAWPGREVARPEWRRQRRLCLYPGSRGAMEGVRQGAGEADCALAGTGTLEDRLRGRVPSGIQVGSGFCSSPPRFWSLLLQGAFPDHNPHGPICALRLWVRIICLLVIPPPLTRPGAAQGLSTRHQPNR